MKKCFATIILALLLIQGLSILVAPLDHLTQETRTTHHSLRKTHHRTRIHHNMRLFRGQTQHLTSHHLTHLAASPSEEYGINDMGYYMTMNITVGGVFYRPNLDTGSSDFWIKGDNSRGKPSEKYICPDCVDFNQHYQLGYLDGNVKTYLVQSEVVTLGKHRFNTSLLVGYQVQDNFKIPEGIIGLSFPGLAQKPGPTFIQSLIDHNIINTYSFGINLNFQQHGRSFISFGQPDPTKYYGQLQFEYLSPGAYSYRIQTFGIVIGNNRLMDIDSALLDTGNSCISIPDRFENDIVDQFGTADKVNVCRFDNEPFARQFSLLRCIIRDWDRLPVLQVVIGKRAFSINKDAYIQQCVKDGDLHLCDTYIQIVKYSSNMFLGDGFFTSVYTYFDLQNRRIGMAHNKEKLDYRKMYVKADQFDDEDREFYKNLKKELS